MGCNPEGHQVLHHLLVYTKCPGSGEGSSIILKAGTFPRSRGKMTVSAEILLGISKDVSEICTSNDLLRARIFSYTLAIRAPLLIRSTDGLVPGNGIGERWLVLRRELRPFGY